MERPGPAHRRPATLVFSDLVLVVDRPLPRKVGSTRLVFRPPPD